MTLLWIVYWIRFLFLFHYNSRLSCLLLHYPLPYQPILLSPPISLPWCIIMTSLHLSLSLSLIYRYCYLPLDHYICVLSCCLFTSLSRNLYLSHLSTDIAISPYITTSVYYHVVSSLISRAISISLTYLPISLSLPITLHLCIIMSPLHSLSRNLYLSHFSTDIAISP